MNNVCNAHGSSFLSEKSLEFFSGNTLIYLKCDKKVEQQTNSLQKLDWHSFVIWAKQFLLKLCYST